MSELPAQVLAALADPLFAIGRASERIYAPFLLGGLALGALVWWFKLRGRISLLAFLFPRAIWLHPSSLFDFRFMMVRALISTVTLGLGTVSAVRIGIFVKTHTRHWVDWSDWGMSHAAWVLGLITLASFLLDDLARYLAHRLSHRVPALWAIHQVHHSAEVLTPFTIYRTHPIEGLFMQLASALGLGMGAGLVAGIFHAPLSSWNIAGLHGLSVLWNLLGSNLRHSHVWISYPRWLGAVLMSPAEHQVHHSRDPRHHDKNFGSALSLWDTLLGTHYFTSRREDLLFGLDAAEQNHSPTVVSALVSPIVAAVASLFPQAKPAPPDFTTPSVQKSAS